MKATRLGGMAALVLAIALATGCGGGVKVTEGEDGEGRLTITNDDGKQFTLSGENELPEGFPQDIPMPDGIVVTASTSSDSSGNMTVAIESELPFDELVKLYREYADGAGYEETLKMEEEGYYMYSGSRNGGDEVFTFNFALDQESGDKVGGALVYDNKPE